MSPNSNDDGWGPWSGWLPGELNGQAQNYIERHRSDGQREAYWECQWTELQAAFAAASQQNASDPRTPQVAQAVEAHRRTSQSGVSQLHDSPQENDSRSQDATYITNAGSSTSQALQAMTLTEPDGYDRMTVLPNEELIRLDKSYKELKASEMTRFFSPGRVFSALWTEPTKDKRKDGHKNMGDAFTVVRWDELVFTEIRRFIVIKRQNNLYSICVPISSYRGNGAVGRPNIQDHAIIYTGDTVPDRLPGEERMQRYPLQMVHAQEGLQTTSRINFSQCYTVHHNIKVKTLGKINENHLPWVMRYYDESIRA